MFNAASRIVFRVNPTLVWGGNYYNVAPIISQIIPNVRPSGITFFKV